MTKLVQHSKLREDRERLWRNRTAVEEERSALDSASEKASRDARRLEERTEAAKVELRRLEADIQKRTEQLAEELEQIALVKDNLLRVQSEQDEASLTLKEEERTLNELPRC